MRASDYVGQGVRVYTKIDYKTGAKTGAAFCMSPEDWILPADHVYQFVVNDGPVSSHQSTTGSGGGTDRGGHGCGRGPGRGSGLGCGGIGARGRGAGVGVEVDESKKMLTLLNKKLNWTLNFTTTN